MNTDGDPGAIAIIGMACRFPQADTPERFWEHLSAGAELLSPVTAADLADEGLDPELATRPGYVPVTSALDGIDLFDAAFFGFTPREAALLDPQQRIFLECVWEALEDSGRIASRGDQATGVFAGANLVSYLMNNVAPGGPLLPGSEGFDALIHNDKDYLATRIAYRLGLTGPAVTVQSACSTSLVAVHLACQSLLDGECDLAVAGGASIRVPQRTGYFYEEGLIFSPDGHCRPFDADASGTVFGNGAGVVVLKRLEDALADDDRVEAIIRGSATNNDGAVKAGFTAPGVDGQTRVISTALGVAGVDAATVTAIEAHGTGTPLGDPIEITALTRAFREYTDERGFCSVSSVKSNVGHLDTAAGIVGLIKAVLQIRHRRLAPNVHYRRPNRHIDFAGTPFFVPAEFTAWSSPGPRRIGVSSFGIGGTNAHVIVEEPSPRAAATAGTPRPRILMVSGRVPAAAAEAAARLSSVLAGPGPVADVARTLRHHREHFRYRRIAVGAEPADLARQLDGPAPAADAGTTPPRCVFGFPGQGSQYPGMTRGLYDDHDGFGDQVDECARVLAGPLGLDLRDLLYPRDGSAEERAVRLTDTAIAQPALFVVGYALTRLLESEGLRPDAMIGHSVGELTAACVAGVIARDDALNAIAARGRLMAEQPPGGMLTVALTPDELQPLLGGDLTIAAMNGPALSVVSGPHDELDAFAATLDALGAAHHRLHTSHAFHSAMMEPAAAAFAAELAGTSLSAPAIRFVSNVTGTWITDAEATDPRYWGRQLRAPVRFADGVTAAAGAGRAVFLEVGPGEVLGKLTRQCLDRAAGHTVVSTVPSADARDDARDAGAGGDDLATVLTAVGHCWAAGVELNPAGDTPSGPPARLPAYPFQRKRYWVAPPGSRSDGAATETRLQVPSADELDAADATLLRSGLTAEYTAPRTELETRVAACWREFLGGGPVGVHDNFFELGGHSLAAAQLVSRLRRELGLAVSLRHLLSHPTVAGLLENPDDETSAAAEELPTIEPDPARLHEPFPLTEMQQAQWLGRSAAFDVGNVAAHVYLETEGDGLDVDRLVRAWQDMIERHDVLRMVVLPDGRQRILPGELGYQPEVDDLRSLTPPEADERVAAARDRMAGQVRPAGEWPLWELRFALLPGGAVRTQLSFDLLVADVAGLFFTLLPDWRRAYEGQAAPPLALSFRDYAVAEHALHSAPGYQRSLDYWRERVRELPDAPALPALRSAADLADPRFERLTARIGGGTWKRVKERATQHGITPSVLLAAAYASALATWSASQRFTINATAVNRLPLHPDVGALLGEFASFGLLEVDAATPATFAELAGQLQERSWKDMEHNQVSGVRVLRELARVRGNVASAMMPVVFTSALARDGDASPFSWLGDLVSTISQTPQVTVDCFVVQIDSELDVSWHVLAGLFPDGLIEAIFGAFMTRVGSLADEAGWDAPAAVPVPARDLAARAEANDTAGPLPEGLLHDPLLRQIESRPDAPAVITEDGTLTFGELGARARAARPDCAPGEPVAVEFPKGADQVVAVLAVALAGGAYVPVDPDLPEQRRAWVREQSGARLAITPGSDGAPAITGQPRKTSSSERRTAPADVAYIIYTSGSTGTPKGVAVSHRAALNTCDDIARRFAIGPDDRVLGLSSMSFDLSVFDTFGVLGAGGALVLPPCGTARDAAAWIRLIIDHQVTVWNTVPALAEMLITQAEADGVTLPLRLVLLSGDWIPVSLPGRVRAAAPEARVISLGGATEAAVWSIWHPVAPGDASRESVPYGRPLRGQSFQVLNGRLEPCPEWVAGELFIGGAGLAEGYWRDPGRTAASFIAHPVSGERLYRTGDLGRYLPGGVIQFLGREDDQVKIGGYRIELGEIEHALSSHDGVRHAVVSTEGERPHQRLVAYVVPASVVPASECSDPDSDPGGLPGLLREHLSAWLPGYMVPREIVAVDAIRLTANGKVDRAALALPAAQGTAPAPALDPAVRAVAEHVARVVAETLGVENVSLTDNFFSLGGDSILGVQVINTVAADGIDVTPRDLFEHQSIAELAAALAADGRLGTRPDSDHLVPLTAAQRAWLASPHAVGYLTVELTEDADPDILERALLAVIARHDALRLVTDAASGTQRAAEPGDGVYLPEIDLTAIGDADRPAVIGRMITEMAEEADPEAGVPAKATLIRLDDERTNLIWVGHRAALDDRSWRILLTDLARAYTGFAAGNENALPVTAPSFLTWVEQDTGAVSGGIRDGALAPAPAPASVPALGTAPGGAPGEPAVTWLELTAEETVRLRDGLDRAYRMRLGDGLAAAVAWALREETDAPVVTIETDAVTAEEARFEGVGAADLSVTLRPALPAGTDAGPVLAEIKEAREAAGTESESGPHVEVRYVDEAGWDTRPGGPFRLPAGFTGPERLPAPSSLAPSSPVSGSPVIVSAALVDGCLRVRLARAATGPGPGSGLAGTLASRLRAIADHCQTPGSGTFFPADFPLADLEPDELTAFVESLAKGNAGA